MLDQVLSDYIWARAVILTSPTVATVRRLYNQCLPSESKSLCLVKVGMSITIPLAIFSDLMFNAILPTMSGLLGSLMVVMGFIWVTTVSSSELQEQMPAYHYTQACVAEEEDPATSIEYTSAPLS